MRGGELEDEQTIINGAAQAYAKALMLARDHPQVFLPEFLKIMDLSDEAWSLIDLFTAAATWDDVPAHRHHPLSCKLCEELATAG
jgi:hypothetical protein